MNAPTYRNPRTVIAAAIRHETTKHIIVGPRHFDGVMRPQILAMGGDEKTLYSENLYRQRAPTL